MEQQKHPIIEFWHRLKRNKGAVFGLVTIILFILSAVFAPLLALHDPAELFSQRMLGVFGAEHLLGTDDLGRDVFSRLIYGARISLSIGLFVVIFALSVGSFLGLVAGYFEGVVDRIIMRLVDIIMSLPSILLALVVIAILGPSLTNTIIAVGIVAIPGFVRPVRAAVIVEKNKKYVEASRNFGSSHLRRMLVSILPNCLSPLIVQGTLGFSEAILNAAALGFLGLGAQPPTPEWGTLLADARDFITTAPRLTIFPGICILIIVLAFNLLGDGLRDAFDPKLRNQ